MKATPEYRQSVPDLADKDLCLGRLARAMAFRGFLSAKYTCCGVYLQIRTGFVCIQLTVSFRGGREGETLHTTKMMENIVLGLLQLSTSMCTSSSWGY